MKDVDKKPEKEVEKGSYTKPVLTKHKQLKDITAMDGSNQAPLLGCTRSY